MRETILITGGSGFLGSQLALRCIASGYRIIGIDRRPPAQPELWSKFTVQPVIEVDWGSFLQGEVLKTCFHLAASASVPLSVQNPYTDFQSLLPGTASLLSYIIRSQKACHLVLFSSAAVYGNPQMLPVEESAQAQPLSPYGVHKYLAEQLLQSYSAIYGITGSILRIFSAYGAGLRRQLFWDILHKYWAALATGTPQIELFGTGQESRDFIHSQDVAQAALLVGEHPRLGQVQIVNVANGCEVTIAEAVAALLASATLPVQVKFTGQARVGDPSRWVADVRCLQALGYEPQITLKSGLVEYFRWVQSLQLEKTGTIAETKVT
ncbi:NAD-dependent epimerase/dehydratase family protein [Anthocerotibacter panamensis]|uniref:NAD-dependent epimerase/dehydratase family protein n=1 Tax=Anthocerotibacter panamensis TaxID=2857077 RepID=UPI001C404758|nr:NAD-dependent epimerase/dehydratase family protein [Anthocerotibacter panamensis]